MYFLGGKVAEVLGSPIGIGTFRAQPEHRAR